MTEPTTDPTATVPIEAQSAEATTEAAVQPATTEETQEAARRGRGPTRPALRFADIVTELEEATPEIRERVLNSIRHKASADSIHDDAKRMRSDLRVHVLGVEKDIENMERVADIVSDVEKLTPKLARALLGVFAEPVETEAQF